MKMTEPPKNNSFWKQMSFKEKCHYLWNNITVEPLLAFFVMPSMLTNLGTQNLNLEKACRVNLNYTDIICDALTNRQTANYTLYVSISTWYWVLFISDLTFNWFFSEEKEVQKLVAGMSGWRTAIQSALPCMLILFWGSMT